MVSPLTSDASSQQQGQKPAWPQLEERSRSFLPHVWLSHWDLGAPLYCTGIMWDDEMKTYSKWDGADGKARHSQTQQQWCAGTKTPKVPLPLRAESSIPGAGGSVKLHGGSLLRASCLASSLRGLRGEEGNPCLRKCKPPSSPPVLLMQSLQPPPAREPFKDRHLGTGFETRSTSCDYFPPSFPSHTSVRKTLLLWK